MKLIREDKEVAAFSIIPPVAYDQLKVFGHVFFASLIQLQREELSQSDLKAWVEGVIPNIERALKELEQMPFEAKLRAMLDDNEAFIVDAIGHAVGAGVLAEVSE